MATVTISFEDQNEEWTSEDFTADSNLMDYIDEYVDKNDCNDWEVDDWDLDFDSQMGPNDFDDLNEWGEYCELVDEHGEAFVLFYNDCGGCSEDYFREYYQGCWSNVEEFVQQLIEDCYDLDIPPFVYIDWERTARDVMMDYSTYEDSKGHHIFQK